jgi:hypothetical protein
MTRHSPPRYVLSPLEARAASRLRRELGRVALAVALLLMCGAGLIVAIWGGP